MWRSSFVPRYIRLRELETFSYKNLDTNVYNNKEKVDRI